MNANRSRKILLSVVVIGAIGAVASLLASRRRARRRGQVPVLAPHPAVPVGEQRFAATRRRSRGRKVLLTMLVIGVVGAAAGVGTLAAFSSTTSNSGNSFTAGTVVITDNDSGAAMLSLSNAKPGDSSQSCITATYSGSLSANVHLYGSTTGSLPSYLTLTITQGTGTVSFGSSCTNFSAGSQIYSGTLANFSSTYTNYSTGLSLTQQGGSSTWASSDYKVYKFVVSLNDNNSAQSLSGTATFTWEAQNT